MFKKLMNKLSTQWKTIHSAELTLEYESILFKKQWDEEKTLIIEENKNGKRRALFLHPDGSEKVDLAWALKIFEK